MCNTDAKHGRAERNSKLQPRRSSRKPVDVDDFNVTSRIPQTRDTVADDPILFNNDHNREIVYRMLQD